MSTLREQFSAVRKAQVETQLDFVRKLTTSVVDNAGQVVALNLSTGRSSIEKSTEVFRKLLSATSPRELVDLSTQSKAGFDTLLSYSNELFNIASRAQSQLIKSATPVLPTALAAPVPALPSARVEVEVQAEVAAPAQAFAEPVAAAAQPVQAALKALPEVVEHVERAALEAAAPAPAIDVAEEVPLADGAAKVKQLSQAVSDTFEHEAPVLAAAPDVAAITAETVELTISGIEPVDAVAPPAPVTGKPVENVSVKARKKR